jgi:hypothetical protein
MSQSYLHEVFLCEELCIVATSQGWHRIIFASVTYIVSVHPETKKERRLSLELRSLCQMEKLTE